ncbi:response regulator transcription factor [Desulfocurvus sp. DL9XJH121]
METITLLVADDEIIVRSFIRQLVEEEGLPVSPLLQARNGLEAVEAARAHQPDLVLLDIRMPGLNGLEAAERIRGCAPRARIVILSAYDDFEYARKALRAGATDYLLKPVRPADVAKHIREVYEAGREAARAPEPGEAPDAARRSWPQPVRAAAEYAAGHLDEKLTLEALAEAACCSPYHLSRLFTRHTGRPLMSYVRERRIARAKELLADASLSITEVAVNTGFESAAYFSESFKKLTGASPSQFRKSLLPGG